MTVRFAEPEIPVAYSMVRAARRLRKRRDGFHPFERYTYYWMAFNNIYTVIAYSGGRHPTYKKDDSGQVETETCDHCLGIPKVKRVGEQEQIDLAIDEFDSELKRNIIHHDKLLFFLHRTPQWHGVRIEEFQGRRLNGVINVNYTTDKDYPVWSPIDVERYNTYIQNPRDIESEKLLTKQIIKLLYTVRNNMLHGGKIHDDANDMEVVGNATPILATIVGAFIHERLGAFIHERH